MTLPSTVIIDEQSKVLDVISLYLSPVIIDPILRFYGSDAYKTVKWEDYKKNYRNGNK